MGWKRCLGKKRLAWVCKNHKIAWVGRDLREYLVPASDLNKNLQSVVIWPCDIDGFTINV